jgi:hypothetical protein
MEECLPCNARQVFGIFLGALGDSHAECSVEKCECLLPTKVMSGRGPMGTLIKTRFFAQEAGFLDAHLLDTEITKQ